MKQKKAAPHFQKPSEIRAAVVGYGGAFNMGRAHLEQMKSAGMTPTAVVEVDPARLAVATTDFPGIETYSSIDELLKNSTANLVTIITPHNSHAPLALKVLRAGRHVVCEKPLALTTAEVDAMIAAASKNRVMLSTYHNRHWDGRILLARDLIQKRKAIGDIIRIECHMGSRNHPGDWWRTSRTISGGILYDWGVHLLEYSLQLISSPITEVSGFAHNGYWASKTRWKNDTNEDEACAIVRFQSGQWLDLKITNLDSNPKPAWVEVTGTEGSLLIDGDHLTLIQHSGDTSVTTRYKNPPDEGHRYYLNIRDHLVKGAPLVITAEWSRRPIHILDLAVQSAKKGRALPAKYA
ncbi:MAG: Gfo/Idh/MocA family oxidoreductase [Verrucomicrobiia bacterium]